MTKLEKCRRFETKLVLVIYVNINCFDFYFFLLTFDTRPMHLNSGLQHYYKWNLVRIFLIITILWKKRRNQLPAIFLKCENLLSVWFECIWDGFYIHSFMNIVRNDSCRWANAKSVENRKISNSTLFRLHAKKFHTSFQINFRHFVCVWAWFGDQ